MSKKAAKTRAKMAREAKRTSKTQRIDYLLKKTPRAKLIELAKIGAKVRIAEIEQEGNVLRVFLKAL